MLKKVTSQMQSPLDLGRRTLVKKNRQKIPKIEVIKVTQNTSKHLKNMFLGVFFTLLSVLWLILGYFRIFDSFFIFFLSQGKSVLYTVIGGYMCIKNLDMRVPPRELYRLNNQLPEVWTTDSKNLLFFSSSGAKPDFGAKNETSSGDMSPMPKCSYYTI